MALRKPEDLTPVGKQALRMVERGYYVVPLCWPDEGGKCGCFKHHTGKSVGKAPLLGDDYQDVRSTVEDVLEWWTRWPNANYGILLAPSHLWVLDDDSLEADREVEELGCPPGPRIRRADRFHRYGSRPAHVPLGRK